MKKKCYYGRGVPKVNLKKLFLMTKIGFLLVVCLHLSAFAEGYGQKGKVSLDLHNVTLEEVLKELKQQTGMRLFYSVEKMKGEKIAQVKVDEISLDEALQKILKGTRLTYSIQEDVIVIQEIAGGLSASSVHQIKGKVKDLKGNPLPGVSVFVKGTTVGIATDVNGVFKIPVNNTENLTLVFSFIGMKTKELKYNGQAMLEVVLEEDQAELNEVVCTGYQTLSRERVTGSFSVISGEQIENKTPMNFMERLEGMSSGLFIHKGEYSIRGISTFDDAKPLVVVDGFPIEGDVETINPNDIDQVTILKDAAAASIWGAKASNGVVVITTKSGRTSGDDGRRYINYTDDFQFEAIPDYDYLDNASPAASLQLEREAAPHSGVYNVPEYMYFSVYSPVQKIYEDYLRDVDVNDPANAGKVTKAEELYAQLGKLDNRQQLKDALLKSMFRQQHNFTISGSTDKNAHYISVNYNSEQGGYVGYKKQNMLFSIKEIVQILPKLSATFGANISFTKGTDSNVDREWFNLKPYDMLADENGNALPIYYKKSVAEIDYLKGVGAMDESIAPLNELNNYSKQNKSNNNRLFAVLNYKMLDCLSVDVRYQMERGYDKDTKYSSPDSWAVANLYNQYTYREDGVVNSLIPKGGMYEESKGETESYSLRASIDFNKTFGKHELNVVAGGERSAVRHTITRVKKLGYDKQTLLHEPVDFTGLANFLEYDKLYDIYGSMPNEFDNFSDVEDRFVAFFGNLSYLLDGKYSLTGSARIDQSNLFGTDPKYRYTPLWSVGAGWDISKENFFSVDWVDRLHFRTTYGINGYASKMAGPFLVLMRQHSYFVGEMGNAVISFPNDKLRWEKTATTNFAVDYSFLNNRIEGKLEYYIRKTSDVLGVVQKDPTLGMRSLTENTASISNKGIELELNTVNISNKNFKWTSHLIFSYNKNKVTNVVTDIDASAAYQWTWDVINVKGKPKDSFYRYRWAGLSAAGDPQVYDAAGKVVRPQEYTDMNDKDALVYCGTIHPLYTGSFTNVLSYKGFELSLMFVMNGGHKMMNDLFSGQRPGSTAIHKDVAKMWRNPGDELHTNVPRIDYDDYYGGAYSRSFYSGADINILDATYIKLRELLLTYKLPSELFRKLPVSGVRLKTQVRNLWYWAANKEGIDPEVHEYAGGVRNLPITPTWTFGVNITF
ncbi:MAG: SusC/RagA family TonB-linked outer membrane protein [Odoribacter sp.]